MTTYSCPAYAALGTQVNNWHNSQIPECTCFISHIALFRTEMYTLLFWMEHCGISEQVHSEICEIDLLIYFKQRCKDFQQSCIACNRTHHALVVYKRTFPRHIYYFLCIKSLENISNIKRYTKNYQKNYIWSEYNIKSISATNSWMI